METAPRNVLVNSAMGILIAVLIIAGVFVSGIYLPGFSPSLENGTLIVLLTDAPVELDHLNVTIDSFAVHKTGTDAGWIDIPLPNGEVYFDLLRLRDDVTMTLTIAEIPAGNYTKMRMTIRTANATKTNGDIIDPLKVPSGRLDVNLHFEINPEEPTTVLIDIQPDWIAISKSNHLRPVLKASLTELPPPPEPLE